MPAQIQPVGVSMNGSRARFTWAVPDDGASPITAYHLKALHYDGVSFSESIEYCDGTNNPLILTNAYCEIPMLTLTGSPFNLP